MLIEKKIIFEAGLNLGEFWLCGTALQKFMQLIPERRKDVERTFYSVSGREKIFIREREKCIHVKFQKLKIKPKWRSGKALVLC